MASEKPIYKDESKDIEERVEDLLGRLTFEEKCKLCAGEGNNSPPAIERLDIPLFGMTDGPHGVSPYRSGVGPSGVKIPEDSEGASTYFPTGIQMASTWNPDLIEDFGAALAEETRAVGRSMQLGPAMNICRNPMNGRTFEYYSEDPLLSGKMGAAAVRGLQSKRIAPCVKHFVANNFESNRFKVNAVIDEQTLREIYLKGFEIVVKESDPWGVMSSYNKINGTYVSEHKRILREILKEEWGFSGMVVSDWGATKHTSGIKGLIEAGLDVEMGSRFMYNIDEMKRMKEAGEFPEEYFDDNIRRFLRTMLRVGNFDDPDSLPEGRINTEDHQLLSRKMAEEGMILLKNDNSLLPLNINKIKKIAIFGKHADIKFGRKKLGGGSSAVFPPYEITVREGLTNKCKGKIEIVEDAEEADVCIVCVGLEHSHDFKGGDHEGSDRLRYDLGILQPRLVNSVVKKNSNTIVVCINGSPFGMEKFADNVPAILEAWYGGMEIGNVVADILFGNVNPSGKLPVSWPKSKSDIHTALSLWDTIIPIKEVVYEEGIFIGYRYYDSKNVNPRFCFGYGLSYTDFEYSNLIVSATELHERGKLNISCMIKNTGEMDGAEIIQLYISDKNAGIKRPKKELKGFKKVFLKAGEEKKVEFELTSGDIAYFDINANDWLAREGSYDILVGASSRDIKFRNNFSYKM
ncbi:MAG: glycosyl hydrolase [Candidatus Lokiarchaeota archaeon]|nr:glycosyl hydrolase [Candidatus Lokiarchaeota archaeon]